MSEYTLEEIRSRHSVRSYSLDSLPKDIRRKLEAEVTMINTHESGLNFQLVFDDGKPFDGFTRSYGMFRNVRNYLACVVDPSFPAAEERAGFFAEKFVMKAVSLGLGTCFVGGTYSKKNVSVTMHVYESLPFVVVFGYAAEKESALMRFAGKLLHRQSGDELNPFVGDSVKFEAAVNKYPGFVDGLEAVKAAPSGINRHPVKLDLDADGDLIAYTDGNAYNPPVDLGIAKYNFSAVVSGEWEWGEKGRFFND